MLSEDLFSPRETLSEQVGTWEARKDKATTEPPRRHSQRKAAGSCQATLSLSQQEAGVEQNINHFEPHLTRLTVCLQCSGQSAQSLPITVTSIDSNEIHFSPPTSYFSFEA